MTLTAAPEQEGTETTKGKVTLGMNVSLDGFVARVDGELDWIFPGLGEERQAAIAEDLQEIDVFMMGRVTYEGMAAHWPTAEGPIAAVMNAGRKLVFSRTPRQVDWGNTTLASGTPAEEIGRLRAAGTARIAVAGGAGFAGSLSDEGLIDEYSLSIHPIVLGAGLPLFRTERRLELLTSTNDDSGVIRNVYRLA